mgnify:CR=1 FL=1
MKKYLSALLALLAVMCFLAVPANAQGHLILPLAICEPSGLILGDVNGDHAVNNKDYASLKRLLADIAEPSDWQADVNDDGMYNNKDLARLKLVLADTFI